MTCISNLYFCAYIICPLEGIIECFTSTKTFNLYNFECTFHTHREVIAFAGRNTLRVTNIPMCPKNLCDVPYGDPK